MSKKEMNRRLSGLTDAQLSQAHSMVLRGWGGYGLTLETSLTLKQANAMFKWVEVYGRVVPTTWMVAA